MNIMRREHIETEDGSYVTVSQRPNEKPKLDVTFFEGDQSVATAIARQRALTKAIKLAKKWRAQKW